MRSDREEEPGAFAREAGRATGGAGVGSVSSVIGAGTVFGNSGMRTRGTTLFGVPCCRRSSESGTRLIILSGVIVGAICCIGPVTTASKATTHDTCSAKDQAKEWVVVEFIRPFSKGLPGCDMLYWHGKASLGKSELSPTGHVLGRRPIFEVRVAVASIPIRPDQSQALCWRLRFRPVAALGGPEVAELFGTERDFLHGFVGGWRNERGGGVGGCDF